VRHLPDPRGEREFRAVAQAGVPAAVPALEDEAEPLAHALGQAQQPRQLPPDLAVGGQPGLGALRPRGHRAREAPRVPSARLPHERDELARLRAVDDGVALARAQVVAPVARRLVGVGGAADRVKQREQVHDAAIGLAAPRLLRHRVRDQAGAQGVLERLARAEVGGQGEGGQELHALHGVR